MSYSSHQKVIIGYIYGTIAIICRNKYIDILVGKCSPGPQRVNCWDVWYSSLQRVKQETSDAPAIRRLIYKVSYDSPALKRLMH